LRENREKAAGDFLRNIAVDASAGTGKTSILVARVTNRFLDVPDLSPDDVLLLTFTEKAAAEMKARITEGWERLFAATQETDDPEEIARRAGEWNRHVRLPAGVYPDPATLRRRVEEMADSVGRLSVTTFHSFCARVLRAFPAEAGVDPLFQVLPEGESADAWDAAFRLFLRGEFGGKDVAADWERILLRVPDPGKVWGVLRRLCLSQRDLLRGGPPDFGSPDDFLRFLLRSFPTHVEYFRAFVAGIAAPDEDPVAAAFRAAAGVLDPAWEAVLRGDLDAAGKLGDDGSAAFDLNLNAARSKKKFPRPEGGPGLPAVRDALLDFFRLLAEVPAGDAAARFLVARAGTALAAYERAKGSGLDFMDLLLRAEGLLSSSPQVARRLSDRFRHIFVDEFQDTDPLQAKVLQALSGDGPPGKLFVVGDPKQSIYGFRRADIQVYRRFREEMVASGGEDVPLSRNFRSRPDLLATLNGLFSRILRGGEDFSPAYAPVVAHRGDPGEGHPVAWYVLDPDVDEPEFLAGLIRRIVGTVKVRARNGADRPASYCDVAVLYRSDASREVLSGYRKALAAARIPYVVPSRKGFFLRQEIQDLRIVLSAIDVPADLSARYAALKTIFFGLSDGEIAPLHGKRPEDAPARTREAVALLSSLSSRRERASLPDLVAELFRATGVDFVAARLPEGERILQNLSKAEELARAFEWEGPGSLKLFLAEIRRKAAEGREEDEVPDFEEGEDAVRLSTIHAAKGLEFPVVILGALSRGGRKGPEGLRADRVHGLSAVIFPGFRTFSAYREVRCAGRPVTFEEWEREKIAAEERRLLYVAATRAMDRLFLVDGGKGRGSDVRDAFREGIAGAPEAGEGACGVTGLRGGRLRLSDPAQDGSFGGELLRVAVAGPLGGEPAPPAAGWNPPPLPEGETVEDATPVPAVPGPVTLAELHDRARGRRFGEKVHRFLEAFPPVTSPWPPAGATAPAAWEEGERGRWDAIVATVRSSVLYRRLCAGILAGTELPLLDFRDGRASEDRADLVVSFPVPDGGIGEHWIVDYKTGPREPGQEEEYLLKMGEYRGILARAWNAPVRGFVWYVETGEAPEVS
jgi:ATP-dependent helicase/nuclease subunit A